MWPYDMATCPKHVEKSSAYGQPGSDCSKAQNLMDQSRESKRIRHESSRILRKVHEAREKTSE
jgi:hypothetical protein